MTDINPQSDPNATPDDVATLYSWANLHGAKYRDFSAARAQTREKARLRAEQAQQDLVKREQAEQDLERQSREKVEAAHAAADQRAAEEAHAAAEQAKLQEEARLQEEAEQAALAAELAAREAEEASHRAAEQAAQRAAAQAAQHAAEQAAQRAAEEAADQEARDEAARDETARMEAEQAVQQAADRAAEQAALAAAQHLAEQRAQHQAQQRAEQRSWQQSQSEHFSPAPAQPESSPSEGQTFPGYAEGQAYRPAAASQRAQPQSGRAHEETSMPRNPWAAGHQRESAGRPAWLDADSQETPAPTLPGTPGAQAPSSILQAPEDTLQGSRDRITSRWFALRGVFDGSEPPTEAIPAPAVSRAPAMAVFSLAGGVGKTSLVATLGRALSARGERVLLVDTAAFGLLPFFFGATDQRPGLLRTFSPPGVSSDAPIQMVTIDPEGLGVENPESLSGEIAKFARAASRVIVDLATASGATTRRIMRMGPLVLVPVIPDMNSVVSVSSIDAFFEHNSVSTSKALLPFYVLNQFDASLPLHLDVREVLREQLGERLLPFALRRMPAMSEALAEGMTVMDYAPGSPLAEDFATLAGWVKSLSAPAITSYRGVRWSER